MLSMMGRLFFLFAFLGAFIDSSHEATCNVASIKTQPNFDFYKFSGQWYVLRRSPERIQTEDFIESFSPITDDYAINYIRYGGRSCGYYVNSLNTTSTPGKLAYISEYNTIPFWVIDTDYTDYAFIYMCVVTLEDGSCMGNATGASILARSNTLSQKAKDRLQDFYDETCLSEDQFGIQVQNNTCPFKTHVPVPEDRNCVVNDIVKPQENFDVNRYAGTWFESSWLAGQFIPKETLFQDYQHHYVQIPDGNLSVYIYGRDPGRDECFYNQGRLVMTMTPGVMTFMAGSSEQYVVVETDYTQYAVVYGCQNVSSDGKCVTARSWVWSRTPTLPQEFVMKANRALLKLCVNPSSYLKTSNDHLCPLKTYWPLSKTQNCRVDDLQVTSSFNVERLGGAWYGISWLPENYVKDSDRPVNQMVKASSSASGQLITEYIQKVSGKCMYDKHTYSKTDTAGKYTGDKNSRFSIADTDYDNYAVIYTCMAQNTTTGVCISSKVNVWGRKGQLSGTELAKVNKILQDLCINPSAMSNVVREQGETLEVKPCPVGASSTLTSSLCLVSTISVFLLTMVV